MALRVWRARTPTEMSDLASSLAAAAGDGGIVYLSGDLGAGKTHWTRAFLRALGEAGAVPSPTFSLAQTYSLPDGRTAHHLDFYRLSPGEWRAAGLDEMLNDAKAFRIVEWPERAEGLPRPDLFLRFEFTRDDERQVIAAAKTDAGEKWLRALD